MHPTDTCECHTPKDLLSVEQALDIFLRQVSPLKETETVATTAALGRVLAEPLSATLDIPPVDNSGMDGYAVAISDLKPGEATWLPVRERIIAGDPVKVHPAGCASRIFTGAPVPTGADAVIPQEDCEVDGDHVRLPARVKLGDNIRRRGEDLTRGNPVLEPGARLRPQEIGMIATLGLVQVKTFRRPRVAVFSTGNELMPLGEALGSGQIYDSNRYALIALLQTLGCEIIDLGRVPDDLDATKTVLAQAAALADLIITSGGVSVGEEDYVKIAVEAMGRIDLWRLAIKPGKPLAYGSVSGVPFFGLPGNPVASFATFCLFVRPYLLAMQHASNIRPLSYTLAARFERTRAIKRREYVRARLVHDEQGAGIELYHAQGSAIMSSLTWAEGLAVIPENMTIEKGDPVQFLPFSEFFA